MWPPLTTMCAMPPISYMASAVSLACRKTITSTYNRLDNSTNMKTEHLIHTEHTFSFTVVYCLIKCSS